MPNPFFRQVERVVACGGQSSAPDRRVSKPASCSPASGRCQAPSRRMSFPRPATFRTGFSVSATEVMGQKNLQRRRYELARSELWMTQQNERHGPPRRQSRLQAVSVIQESRHRPAAAKMPMAISAVLRQENGLQAEAMCTKYRIRGLPRRARNPHQRGGIKVGNGGNA